MSQDPKQALRAVNPPEPNGLEQQDMRSEVVEARSGGNLIISQKTPTFEESVRAEVVKLIPTAGTLRLTDEQKLILYAPIDPEAVEIRPDGLIYLPWMEYADRLDRAFGGTGWTMIPDGSPKLQGNQIVWGWHLVIDGAYMGYAIGGQEYYPNNPTMTWADALEGAKSNALMRLCKSIGISKELWRPSYIKAWKEKYAEYVMTRDKYGREKPIWRKKVVIEKQKPEAESKPKIEEESLSQIEEYPEEQAFDEPEENHPAEDERVLAIKDAINKAFLKLGELGRKREELEQKVKSALRDAFGVDRSKAKIPDDLNEQESAYVLNRLSRTIEKMMEGR